MTRVNVTVDGVLCSDDIEPRTLLVQFLREACRLTGLVACSSTSVCALVMRICTTRPNLKGKVPCGFVLC